MADKEKKSKTSLPWGLTADALKPNSVKNLTQNKLKAFSLGRTNPLKKSNPFLKKKEEKEEKKKADSMEAAQVFEEFVASFEDSGKSRKAFVRGSSYNPPGSKSEGRDNRNKDPGGRDKDPGGRDKDPGGSGPGSVYRPSSKFAKEEEPKPLQIATPPAPAPVKKLLKKKGVDKKPTVLELFREELKRAQEERKDRHTKKQTGQLPLDAPETAPPIVETFKVEEYKDMMKGSFDTGNPLTTNLYVGNISPKMNEEMLCQHFGKYGPLASVKVMWPRTEEEKSRNRNCGFVAYMDREDAEKALNDLNGATIMEYEVQVGWGKAVPLPPNPIYVPPDVEAEEKSKVPDPPSGLPFNAQEARSKDASHSSSRNDDGFDEVLYTAVVRVVIPTDKELLKLIHRMIEFVVREGPMFEAMVMNRELNNPLFQFLFDNQSPAHVYYRWKLFSILNGDSPETWPVDEFRMFEMGSIWKPPPLKNLLSKVLPPVQEVVRRGQLSSKNRDELENKLRSISIERSKVKDCMIWCLDHVESADEIVDCICESLCISETPLPVKVARLYLMSDILQNCSAHVSNVSYFRRGFEAKLGGVIEHFHDTFKGIASRLRAEQFKRRIMTCLMAWDQASIFHFNFIDKLREVFIGKTQEELEKQKAYDTVASLIASKELEEEQERERREKERQRMQEALEEEGIDGVPLLDNKPIDFSSVAAAIDGVPMDEDLDGEPMTEDIDGVPMEEEEEDRQAPPPAPPPSSTALGSKWELVDYADDSDDNQSEEESAPIPAQSKGGGAGGGGGAKGLRDKERQQMLAELEEKKRRMLREVELKVVELSDALEATGSYSRAEISERAAHYRDRLMQEAVEPKRTPPPSPPPLHSRASRRHKSRSPSPSTLAKYNLESSPPSPPSPAPPPSSPPPSPPPPSLPPLPPSPPPPPTTSTRHRSPSPPDQKCSSPPAQKSRGRSPSPPPPPPLSSSSSSRKRHHSSRSPSPGQHKRKRSSVSPSSRRRSRSRSHSPKHSRRRSRSPHSHRSSKKSKRRSRSRSPGGHRASKSSRKHKH